ncbi:MAG: glycosidase [Candidatus Scalindua sp. AMX11]|nr:MAG: glycosidase [Candidatus Scalindua sp.]RZV83960.1 MAG: glycosidase [Candidatus Scalindua sp. SCAELEC01]TDE65765.1 MAG: glycosidase [Candidatus Scalindua sp. AMX11]
MGSFRSNTKYLKSNFLSSHQDSFMNRENDLSNVTTRYSHNPILDCHAVNKVWKEPHLKVMTVHNAGVTIFEKQVVMLFRSHLRNGVSVIGIARSKDGLTGWEVGDGPVLKSCNEDDLFADGFDIEKQIESEAGGVEDPRISKIDNTYLITYSAYHGTIKNQVRVSLVSTQDFKTFLRYGPVLKQDMRNVVIFPEKINNRFLGLFRPNDSLPGDLGGRFQEILLGSSEDWRSGKWNIEDPPIIKQLGGPSSFSDKIGPGATPIRTSHGWINIFHGVRNTMGGNPYVLGVALHELDNPKKVVISNIPILFPTSADCRVGEEDYVHVPNVVFCCGAIRKEDGSILIYYGGNDTVMNVCFTHEDVLAQLCLRYPQNPETGRAEYSI